MILRPNNLKTTVTIGAIYAVMVVKEDNDINELLDLLEKSISYCGGRYFLGEFMNKNSKTSRVFVEIKPNWGLFQQTDYEIRVETNEDYKKTFNKKTRKEIDDRIYHLCRDLDYICKRIVKHSVVSPLVNLNSIRNYSLIGGYRHNE